MSFMLSSPRLIYDYAEKIGRCKLIKNVVPYYQTARKNFFNIDKETEQIEHYIYNVETLYLDDESKEKDLLYSNLENYSYSNWEKEEQLKYNGIEEFNIILNYINKSNCSINSKNYLKNIFNNWKDKTESDYQSVGLNFGENYNLVDYIRYCYENNKTNLSHDEYIGVLKLLNTIIKNK